MTNLKSVLIMIPSHFSLRDGSRATNLEIGMSRDKMGSLQEPKKTNGTT